MSGAAQQNWQWSELDPLTQSVVACFTWRIGDESRGDISGEAFIDAMTETFADMTTEDVKKIAAWGGPEGMRNTIINKLSGFQPEPVINMTRQLGRLAGGGEAIEELAAQAGEQLLISHSGSRATPALRVLSELAISRR